MNCAGSRRGRSRFSSKGKALRALGRARAAVAAPAASRDEVLFRAVATVHAGVGQALGHETFADARIVFRRIVNLHFADRRGVVLLLAVCTAVQHCKLIVAKGSESKPCCPSPPQGRRATKLAGSAQSRQQIVLHEILRFVVVTDNGAGRSRPSRRDAGPVQQRYFASPQASSRQIRVDGTNPSP